MILQKKYYDELKGLLQENKEEKYIDPLLKQLDEELLYETMRCFEKKDKQELKKYLGISDRYRKLLEEFISEKREKSFFSAALLIGEFNGIVKMLEKIFHFLSGKEESRQKLTRLCTSRNYIREILLFIYRNPDIRHKDLADKTGINPNYLNELVKLLEPTGSVNRYAYGRCTYYELTLEGRRYVEEYLKDDESDDGGIYLNKDTDILQFDDKIHTSRANKERDLENVKERRKEIFKIYYYNKNENSMKLWG